MLNYRKDVVLKGTGANALWGASYLVTAYPVGAEASAGSAGTTITVRAGHSFRASDKILLNPGSDNIFSGTDSVQSVTATTIVMGSSYSVASGDLLVNLGPDTGSSAPNFDRSPMKIYTDPAGAGSAATNATVTCDSQGEYEYYHKGDGRFWELIRSSATAVVEASTGFGGVAGRLNVCDFGAAGDGSTDDSARIQAAIDSANSLEAGDVYLPDYTFAVSSTVQIKAQVFLVGDGYGGQTGTAGSRISSTSGTVTPILKILGTSAASRHSRMGISRLIVVGSNTSTQVGLSINYATNVIISKVTFYDCGQAEDIDDAYRVLHDDVHYGDCGRGDTAATATVRAENRSNPSVRTEQIYFDNCLWEGDIGGKQGIALYAGPDTTQVRVVNSKLDYASTSPTHRIIVAYDTRILALINCIIGADTIATAAAVIDIGGDATDSTFEWTIAACPSISSSNAVPAVRADYAKWGIVVGNTFVSATSGNAGLITLTANAVDNTTLGNFCLRNTDVLVLDSGTRNLHNNRRVSNDYFESSAIGLGASPSSTGLIRLPNSTTGAIKGRNAANSGDVILAYIDTNDDVQTGTDLRVAGHIGVGRTPLSLGVALLNNEGLYGRNAANSADITLVILNTSDQVLLGSGGTAGVYSSATGGFHVTTTATITASTTQTQGQGALTADINEVSVCANVNDTVTLPAAVLGMHVLVINNGAQTMQIFPASGDNLGAGANTATTITTAQMMECWSYDSTNWKCVKHTKVT